MHDAVSVQVVEPKRQRVSNLLDSDVLELEVSLVEVLIEVFSLDELHDDEDVLPVFEDVVELDDVGVFADLEDFDLVPEHVQLVRRDLLLLYLLDRHFRLGLLVDRLPYQPELAFAESFSKLVEVVNIAKPRSLLEDILPGLPLLQSFQVEDSGLDSSDLDLNGVESHLVSFHMLWNVQEGARETVHEVVLQTLGAFLEVDLVPHYQAESLLE